jgi:hypothetical protein
MIDRLLLSFSFNEHYRYWPKFMESVRAHVGIPTMGVTLGPWHEPPPVDTVNMPEPPIMFGRPIVQHGAFLQVLRDNGVNSGCIVLFVDVDAIFQRPFDSTELNLLATLGMNNYLVGPNRIHDRVEMWQDEAPRVLPTEAYEKEYRGQFDATPVFNTGFLAMHFGVWEAVYNRVCGMVDTYGHWFGHHAATQLFLCAAMKELDLAPCVAPLSMSAHGHCGPPPGLRVVDDKAYIATDLPTGDVKLDKVAYAHMLCGL